MCCGKMVNSYISELVINSILGECCHQKPDRESGGNLECREEGTVNEVQKPNLTYLNL